MKIFCAAIYFDDGKVYAHQPRNIETGIVFCGRRHHNIFPLLEVLYPERHLIRVKEIQGFLTTEDTFVDRKEALGIAEAAGQIVMKHNPKKELVSEDMW